MFIVDNYVNVLSIIGSVVILKFAITTVLVRAFGYLPNTALLSGLGKTQIGEFSFILVAAALTLGVVDQEFHSLIVVSAVLTMAVAPTFISGGTWAVGSLSQRVRLLRPYRLASNRSEERPSHLTGHVIICRLGRVGSLVAQALQEYQITFIAVDLNPRILNQWRAQGHFTILGSSGSVEVLTAARVHQAGILVISTEDPVSAYVTPQHALQLRPDLDIVARVH